MICPVHPKYRGINTPKPRSEDCVNRGCVCLSWWENSKIEKISARLSSPTYGLCGTITYNAWSNMKNRCNSADGPLAKWYYDKGIKYCDKWETFEGFFEDMGYKPPKTHLDRIDGNLGYCVENCRWASYRVSYMNRSYPEGKDKLPKGIRLNRAGNYNVRGTYKNVETNLGTFKTLEEAIEIRQKWEIDYAN